MDDQGIRKFFEDRHDAKNGSGAEWLQATQKADEHGFTHDGGCRAGRCQRCTYMLAYVATAVRDRVTVSG